MIKEFAWNIFKNTGNVNTYLELKQLQDVENMQKDGNVSNQILNTNINEFKDLK